MDSSFSDTFSGKVLNFSSALTDLSIEMAKLSPSTFHSAVLIMKAQLDLSSAQNHLLATLNDIITKP